MVIFFFIFRESISNNKSDFREISQKQRKIGNKPKRREFKKKKEKLSKPRDLKKKEKKDKAKKYDSKKP